MERAVPKRAHLTLSERSETTGLRDYLTWAAPGVRLLQMPGRSGEPDQLTLIAGPAALAAALRLLPGYLRSRPGRASVIVTVDGTSVTLTGDSPDTAIGDLAQLLH